MTFNQFVEEFLKAAILQAWINSVKENEGSAFFQAVLAMDAYGIGVDDGRGVIRRN